jgi:molecular chaperone GrpE
MNEDHFKPAGTETSTASQIDMAQAAEAVAEAMAAGDSSADGVLSALQTERDQFFDSWRRVQAEFDNYRKRQAREAEQTAKYAAVPVIRDILPGLDNLRRLLEAAQKGGQLEDLTKGVELTLKHFESILEKNQAHTIPGVGTPFDPNLHEAISQVPSAEHPPMTVLMEVERGYVIHDRVVRPSKVIVSAAPVS